MIIAVMGGAGFLGRRIIRLLAARGHQIVSFDIVDSSMFDDLGTQVRSVRGDLTRFKDVIAAFITHKPDVVINLSYTLGSHHPPYPAMQLNIVGMENCFEAARLCDVRHVIFASSIAVNGSQELYGDKPVTETDPVSPNKQYAVHKVFNEWQAHEYRTKHNMQITGIRPANVSGIDKLIGSVDHVSCIVKPAMGEKIRFAYRDRMRCVVYVDDVAEIFTRIALAEKPAHHIYNTGGESLSLGQIADMVKVRIPDADISFEHETGGLFEAGATAYRFSHDRLATEFGIQYRPFDQRVEEMIKLVRQTRSKS